ncbi:MAG: UDP-N-acetylmuramoyl-L-alanine--D-glutamate ligase [Kiritimatiellae bacterium]|nr:UDP-N-acetylmuramoyl-L-alanine--D-glutamate ligase [Kiritimatiellia bacterium]MDD4735200.1 UDP-N-acetylmuramoyl-L-alanine--D-glutamate ligase [Kiritimatiellia bacterium]
MKKTGKQHWLVLGLGLSGSAAVRLLLSEGRRVSVLTDREGGGAHGAVMQQVPDDSEIFFDEASVPWREIDGCVVSPGIPTEHPWLCGVRQRGIPLIPEFELGWMRFGGRTIAVTGSNGKSTFVKWCVETLRETGVDAVVCGNYGVPVCDCVMAQKQPEALVIELSSFQLEAAVHFAPDVAVLLNLLSNHLDRHGDMERYTRIKLKLFEQMNPDAPALLPYSLKAVAERLYPEKRWVTFGVEEGADYLVRKNRVMRGEDMPGEALSGTMYGNRIMQASGAAACAWMDAMKINRSTGLDVLRSMKPLPHRQETVANHRGVRFVNDSKATNLAALCAAVEAFGPRVRLIAGGQAKEKDFKSAKEVLAQNTRKVYLIGRDAEKMAAAWGAAVPCVCCCTLEQAVQTAWRDAAEGDAVLLSPGCTSYDQFKNFEERGRAFAEVVRHLEMEE